MSRGFEGSNENSTYSVTSHPLLARVSRPVRVYSRSGRRMATPIWSKVLSHPLNPKSAEPRPWLIWDGECGVCCWWVEWARKRGAGTRFQIVPYQNAPDPPMNRDLRARAGRSVQVITPEGRNLQTGRACLFILDGIGKRATAKFWGTPPMVWFFELGYRVMARNRSLFSKFMSRDPKTCGRKGDV